MVWVQEHINSSVEYIESPKQTFDYDIRIPDLFKYGTLEHCKKYGLFNNYSRTAGQLVNWKTSERHI